LFFEDLWIIYAISITIKRRRIMHITTAIIHKLLLPPEEDLAWFTLIVAELVLRSDLFVWWVEHVNRLTVTFVEFATEIQRFLQISTSVIAPVKSYQIINVNEFPLFEEILMIEISLFVNVAAKFLIWLCVFVSWILELSCEFESSQ